MKKLAADRKKRRHTGLPRTLTHALKFGYETIKDPDFRPGADAMSQMISLSHVGSRQNSICGIARAPDGSYLICYKDADKNCTWVPMPREAIEGHHAH